MEFIFKNLAASWILGRCYVTHIFCMGTQNIHISYTTHTSILDITHPSLKFLTSNLFPLAMSLVAIVIMVASALGLISDLIFERVRS